jgi:hypothetical protein
VVVTGDMEDFMRIKEVVIRMDPIVNLHILGVRVEVFKAGVVEVLLR